MTEPRSLPAPARDAIMDWYTDAGRRLPFRATTDPYGILVSEAMAQQTQAARAGEAWTRFMDAFPTVASLAAATPADILRAWHGLGYNRRALNLWRAARRIVEVHGGAVPADLEALRALPGVGPYTARAVAAIAFGMAVGAVDTNVRRVIGRIVEGDPARLDAASLQATADAAVLPDRPADWTHAVMDLGAMVCTPRRPDCAACPARHWCRYADCTSQAAIQPATQAATKAASRAATQPATPRALDAFELYQPGGHVAVGPKRVPFPSTSRWLRGRIVDRLRAVQGDGWSVIEAPIGAHDMDAVRSTLDGLAREGLVELGGTTATGGRRARLPLG